MLIRLKHIRERRNLTQEDLSTRLKVHKRTISNWETGFRFPNSKQRKKICDFFGISEAELFLEDSHQLQISNQSISSVPVISWVHANQFADISDPFPVGVSDTYVLTPAKGKSMFALKIKNDCMEPEFLEGETIIVNPDAEPKNGDFVIVRDNKSKEATFKQLKIYGNKIILHPLNAKFPDIELEEEADRYEIIGKVVEKIKRY